MVKLVPTSTTVVQTEWRRPLHPPLRCDGDGNIDLRGFEQGNPASPVLRLNRKGDRVTTFSVGTEDSLQKGVVQDFTVSPDGDVFELVFVDNDTYVASFSGDGLFKSKTKIERQFWPTHVAVLAGGTSFLITGSELPVKGGPPPKLINAIFDTSGRLIKEIAFARDPAELTLKNLWIIALTQTQKLCLVTRFLIPLVRKTANLFHIQLMKMLVINWFTVSGDPIEIKFELCGSIDLYKVSIINKISKETHSIPLLLERKDIKSSLLKLKKLQKKQSGSFKLFVQVVSGAFLISMKYKK